MIRFSLLTALCVCASLSSAMAASVEHVSVHVASVQEAMPPLVQKRIAASIQTVGNHVFLHHDDADIRSGTEAYTYAVTDIINRVLIGYTVETIQITPGPDTVLNVQIRPWGETIRSVRLAVDYGALPEMGRRMADADLKGAQPIVENLLVGLPVDALDWANGAVKSVMESELQELLPEFYPHIVIEPGKDASVNIYLLPKLPVVRNVDIDVDAENLPKIIFLSTRKHMEQRYAGLEGLPVSFVRRHEQDIQADLQKNLADQWVIKEYKLHVQPTLSIGENTEIHLLSQTDFYDIQAGAYMDVGRDKGKHDSNDDTVIKAHLGRKVGSHHEFYSEVEFMPGSVKWNVIPGYFYRWGKYTQMGYQYETTDNSNHLWLRQYWGKRWMLRFDRDLTNQDDEVGLTYRIHEYVGLEYIVSDHDQWLRIIGYL